MNPGLRSAVALCVAEALNMLGVFAFPALLPTFLAAWELNAAEAGWIAGAYFAGYSVAVPFLLALTDRVDARRVYLVGSLIGLIGAAAFAGLAQGFWSALALRALAGIGHAAVYMPGLRALVDRWTAGPPSRAIAVYTASYSLGTALSFLAAGAAGAVLGWRWAFGIAALAAGVAGLLVAIVLRPIRPERPTEEAPLLDFQPVFANRPAMSFVLAYAAHVWELFALRSWMVAFLALALSRHPTAGGPAPTTVATLAGLVAMIASLGGQELALRFGRRRALAVMMPASAACAVMIGLAVDLPYGLLVVLLLGYAMIVQADSAALTAGVVEVATPGRRGATLAIHSLIGYSAAFLGPLAVGVVLDAGGGVSSPTAWLWAFIAMGAPVALAPLAIAWGRSPSAR